jgi:glycerol-3-phosphate dehydrogenase
VTLLGTTDVDLEAPLPGVDKPGSEATISPWETEYLLEAAQRAFPCLNLEAPDIQSVYAGVRPVIDTGKSDPSRESREHVLWQENGLLTVAGGKLTTFRLMAQDALRKASSLLPQRNDHERRDRLKGRLLDEPPEETHLPNHLPPVARLRLVGRHGANTPALIAACPIDELQPIFASTALWAELRWAAQAEAVVHLDDLLLRRVRLGLTLPNGGLEHLEDFRRIVQPGLGWDDARWHSEAERYAELWERCYH